jgi:hypothetical protein
MGLEANMGWFILLNETFKTKTSRKNLPARCVNHSFNIPDFGPGWYCFLFQQ